MLVSLTAIVFVQLISHVSDSATPWTAARQPSLFFTVSWSLLKLKSMSQWCHPTISSSVAPFSSCFQSFPASESFSVSQLFASGGLSIGASASSSVLLMNIQHWFPLGLTDHYAIIPSDVLNVSNQPAETFSSVSLSQPLWSLSISLLPALEDIPDSPVLCLWHKSVIFSRVSNAL